MIQDEDEIAGFMEAMEEGDLLIDPKQDFSRMDFQPIEYVKENYGHLTYFQLHESIVPELTQRESDETAGMMKLVIEHLETFIRCKDSLDQLKGSATSKNAMEAIDHAGNGFSEVTDNCQSQLEELFELQKELVGLREVEALAQRISNIAQVPEIIRSESLLAMRTLARGKKADGSGGGGGDADKKKSAVAADDSGDSDSDDSGIDDDEGGVRATIASQLNANTFRTSGELEGSVVALTRAVMFIKEQIEGKSDRNASSSGVTEVAARSKITQAEELAHASNRIGTSTILPLLVQQLHNASNLLLEALFAQLDASLNPVGDKFVSPVVVEQRLTWMLNVARHQDTLAHYQQAVELAQKRAAEEAEKAAAEAAAQEEADEDGEGSDGEDRSDGDEDHTDSDGNQGTDSEGDQNDDSEQGDESEGESPARSETPEPSDEASTTGASTNNALVQAARKLGTNHDDNLGLVVAQHPVKVYLDAMLSLSKANVRRRLINAVRAAKNMPAATLRDPDDSSDDEDEGQSPAGASSGDGTVIEGGDQVNTLFDHASFTFGGGGGTGGLASLASGKSFARTGVMMASDKLGADSGVTVLGVVITDLFAASSGVLIRLASLGDEKSRRIYTPSLDDALARLESTCPVSLLLRGIVNETTATLRRYWLGIHQSVANGRFDKQSLIQKPGAEGASVEAKAKAAVLESGLEASRFTCKSDVGLRQLSFTSIAKTIRELQGIVTVILREMFLADIYALRYSMPRRSDPNGVHEDGIQAAFQFELTLMHWTGVIGNIETSIANLTKTMNSTPVHQGDNTVWEPLHNFRLECISLSMDAVEQLLKLYLHRSYKPARLSADISRKLSAKVLSTVNPAMLMNALLVTVETFADILLCTSTTASESNQLSKSAAYRVMESQMVVVLPLVQRLLDMLEETILHFIDVVRLMALAPPENRKAMIDPTTISVEGTDSATSNTAKEEALAVTGCIADAIATADVVVKTLTDAILKGNIWVPLQEWIVGFTPEKSKLPSSGTSKNEEIARIQELLGVCSTLEDDFQREVCPQLDQVVTLAVDVMVKAFLEKQASSITAFVLRHAVIRSGADWQGMAEPIEIRRYLFRAFDIVLDAYTQFSMVEQPMLRTAVVRQLMTHIGSAFLLSVDQKALIDGWDGSPRWMTFSALLLDSEAEFLVYSIDECCRGMASGSKPQVLDQLRRFSQSLALLPGQAMQRYSKDAAQLTLLTDAEYKKLKDKLVQQAISDSSTVFNALLAQPPKKPMPKSGKEKDAQTPKVSAAAQRDQALASAFSGETDELAKKVAAQAAEVERSAAAKKAAAAEKVRTAAQAAEAKPKKTDGAPVPEERKKVHVVRKSPKPEGTDGPAKAKETGGSKPNPKPAAKPSASAATPAAAAKKPAPKAATAAPPAASGGGSKFARKK